MAEEMSDPLRFVREVLGESPYPKQVEILDAVESSRRVSVVGCNGSGKDWAAARAVLWWVHSRSPAKAIVIGPTSRQVDDIVWKEIRLAYGRAPDRFPGRMYRTSRYEIDEETFALGFTTNSPRDILAESATYDVVAGQVTPIENTDYEANTAQDGSGSDISSELTVTHPNEADFNGKGTVIRVAFGATAGHLTLLKLRTLHGVTFDDPVIIMAEDTTSQSSYGQRTRTLGARWTRQINVAEATVASRLARRKEPRTVLRLELPNGSKPNVSLMLHAGLSDRVKVVYTDMGIDEDFFIEGRRIEVSEGWTLVTTEFLLQAV